MTTPADILRDARRRHGLSQEQLAFRARTSQAAISRIERGEEGASVERLDSLLAAMGERLELSAVPIDHGCDPIHLGAERELTASARLQGALNWARVNAKLSPTGR